MHVWRITQFEYALSVKESGRKLRNVRKRKEEIKNIITNMRKAII